MDSIISLAGDLILPYMILSLFTMLIVEILSRLFRLREKILTTFLLNMLGGPSGEASFRRFFAHPLLQSISLRKRQPAYLPSRLFALAFRDEFTLQSGLSLRDSVSVLPNEELRIELHALLAETPPDREVDALQRWFLEAMDQAAAVFRVRTFVMISVVATTIVVGLNFDALRISRHAVRRALVQKVFEAEVQSIAKTAEPSGSVKPSSASTSPAPVLTSPVDAMRDAEGLLENGAAKEIEFPIGWQGDRWYSGSVSTFWSWLVFKIAGLGTSILAVMLGAPLLFDTLNRYMVIRLAIKPFESPATEA